MMKKIFTFILSITLALLSSGGFPMPAYAASCAQGFQVVGNCVVILAGSPGTGNQTFTVPSDFSSLVTVECIGSGGDGVKSATARLPGPGGGGGAFASTTNITLTAGGTVTYGIGNDATTTTDTGANDTYFNGTSKSGASLYCPPGAKSASATAGGSGGLAANAIPATDTSTGGSYSGGAGGTVTSTNGFGASGGGGSAGPLGIGMAGGSGGTIAGGGGGGGGGADGGLSTVGGNAGASVNGGNAASGASCPGTAATTIGDGGSGTGGQGSASAAGSAAGAGTYGREFFDLTHGAGAGGGGGGGSNGSGAFNGGAGGAGGTYGGGGGGGGGAGTTGTSGALGSGGQGIIAFIYTSTAALTIPNLPSTSVDQLNGDGWTTPSNVERADYSIASGSSQSSGVSQTGDLYVEGFGFSIPAGSTINGVTAVVSLCASKSSTVIEMQETTIKLIKAGTPTGTNKSTVAIIPGAMATSTYGGIADLWGNTLGASDVNASNFGIDLNYEQTGSIGGSINVDYVTIGITYTPPVAGGYVSGLREYTQWRWAI